MRCSQLSLGLVSLIWSGLWARILGCNREQDVISNQIQEQLMWAGVGSSTAWASASTHPPYMNCTYIYIYRYIYCYTYIYGFTRLTRWYYKSTKEGASSATAAPFVIMSFEGHRHRKCLGSQFEGHWSW